MGILSREPNRICAACGMIGHGTKRSPGSFGMELFLWVCFCFPGFCYSLWRLGNRYRVCAYCGSRELFHVGTPRGQQLVEEFHHEEDDEDVSSD